MKRLLFLLLAACGTSGGGGAVFDGGDYTVGSIAFHVASGAAVSSGGLTLVLSDQPDTCQALSFVSTRTTTMLKLKVVPAADGTTRAAVVATQSPAAGQASGSLAQATAGVQGTRYDAADGTVAWTVNNGGSVTLTTLDVGFSGATGRITAKEPMTVPPCTP